MKEVKIENCDIASKYDELVTCRQEYVNRGEEISQLTIPWVFIDRSMTPNGYNEGELTDPHNSVGARGVRNLASRFALTLLPTNTPFFNYVVDDSILDELPEGISRGDVEEALGKITRIIKQNMDKSNLRVESAEIFLHLLVDGNPLFFIDDELKIHTFSLDQFVMKRDRTGRILEIIVKEQYSRKALPDEVKKEIDDKKEIHDESKDVKVYTHVKLGMDRRYKSYQVIDGVVIESTKSHYPEGILPWIAPRIVKVAGEHYGRSYCEEYIGDLRAVESLDKSLLDMAAASSRVIILQNPGSVTDTDELNGAPNGSVVPGRASDFEPLSMNLGGDFSIVRAQSVDIQQRLAQAFLLVSAIQRDAERVTAEEIRLMADELNNSLGGIFSILAEEFQRPLVNIFQWRLSKSDTINVPEDVEVSVVTGLEALGRGQDLSRLNGAIAQLLQLQQAGIPVAQYINPEELISRVMAGNGIDQKGLIKSSKQLQQEQAQQQITQSFDNGGLKEVAKEVVKSQVNQQGE